MYHVGFYYSSSSSIPCTDTHVFPQKRWVQKEHEIREELKKSKLSAGGAGASDIAIQGTFVMVFYVILIRPHRKTSEYERVVLISVNSACMWVGIRNRFCYRQESYLHFL